MMKKGNNNNNNNNKPKIKRPYQKKKFKKMT